MDGFIILVLVMLIIGVAYLKMKPRKKVLNEQDETYETTNVATVEIEKAYQRKWLFSYNEKDAYKKLKEITDQYGYTLFAKVRLFDLVEPIKENPKYKTFRYKIQAKHVDFVICDAKLVARYIIELDDNSHNQKARKERDTFVDTVLESTGYKILHVRTIEKAEIEKFLEQEKNKPAEKEP